MNLSADGQYATFVSIAGNLAAENENHAVDAFVHEPDIVYQPQLTINYQTGAVGSYFTLTGTAFPPHETAGLTVNGAVLGSPPTDFDGGLILSTANADKGAYLVTASVNPTATVSFMINAADPVRSQEGAASIFAVPAGIAFNQFIYLPMIVKQAAALQDQIILWEMRYSIHGQDIVPPKCCTSSANWRTRNGRIDCRLLDRLTLYLRPLPRGPDRALIGPHQSSPPVNWPLRR